jgi:hypothetical protein
MRTSPGGSDMVQQHRECGHGEPAQAQVGASMSRSGAVSQHMCPTRPASALAISVRWWGPACPAQPTCRDPSAIPCQAGAGRPWEVRKRSPAGGRLRFSARSSPPIHDWSDCSGCIGDRLGEVDGDDPYRAATATPARRPPRSRRQSALHPAGVRAVGCGRWPQQRGEQRRGGQAGDQREQRGQGPSSLHAART